MSINTNLREVQVNRTVALALSLVISLVILLFAVIHMHTHTYTHTHTYVRTYVYSHMYAHNTTQTCVCVHTYTSMSTLYSMCLNAIMRFTSYND